jgi:predicted short-subunit dehydrogenase-like oxidoreductase (DUF2520 family)
MKYYNISIIGAGNLAWHLAQDLEKAGHSVKEIFSRDIENAEWLAQQLYDTEPKDDLNFTRSEAELIIICVPDRAIASVVDELTLPPGCVVAHTSGSQPIHILQGLSEHIGVFYPLQSFTTEWPVDFNKVPVFIEYSDDKSKQILREVSKSLTQQVYELAGDKRKTLHLAAVMASNFVNHLLFLSQELMERNGLKHEWLQPLIYETVKKGFEIGFYEAQTGPARRQDTNTISAHLKMLENYPDIAALYKTISDSIMNQY